MMNNAKSEGVIRSHALADVRLPSVPKKTTRPVTWSEEELSVIIGPALDQYEIGQAKWNSKVGKVAGTGSIRTASKLPLRGMILIAYFTLMRPINNWALTWEEVTLDPVKGTGNFELDQHKNVNKGIRAYGRLARPLVDYLLTIRPRNARGYIHPNPETGKPYTNIRKQWDRLIAIASEMLGYPLVNEKADFFTFRHTGATNIAQMASNREELMRVVNMMGDTNVETVRRHYFNFTYDEDDQVIDRWELPKKLPSALAQLVQPGSDLTN
jgi:integrase